MDNKGEENSTIDETVQLLALKICLNKVLPTMPKPRQKVR